jgi:hypothetical protein
VLVLLRKERATEHGVRMQGPPDLAGTLSAARWFHNVSQIVAEIEKRGPAGAVAWAELVDVRGMLERSSEAASSAVPHRRDDGDRWR